MTAIRENISSFVDLDRYPLDNPASAGWSDLVDECRHHLDERGGLELTGFVRQEAVDAMVDEVKRLETSAHRAVGKANARLCRPSSDTSADHPDRIVGRSSLGVVANDLLPGDGVLRALYEWEPLRRFLAAAYREAKIYPYHDELRPLNVFVMRDGDQNWWHLDHVEFTTILQLRNPLQGGIFEYVPLPPVGSPVRLRLLRDVVSGNARNLVRTMDRPPGSLQLFRGRNVVHRVTPVCGPVSRLTVIFGFDAQPGRVSSSAFRIARYGRTGTVREVEVPDPVDAKGS